MSEHHVGDTTQSGDRVQENNAGLGHTVQGHHAPRAGFDQGEHGAGTGASGGVSNFWDCFRSFVNLLVIYCAREMRVQEIGENDRYS